LQYNIKKWNTIELNLIFKLRAIDRVKLKKSIFQFCNILKDIRIENTCKFQREICKIDWEQYSTGRLCAEIASGADKEAFFEMKERVAVQGLPKD